MNWSKLLYTASVFLGLVSTFWGVLLYEKTFIKVEILMYSGLILSLIYFLIIHKHYKKTFGTSSFVFPFFQSVFSVGCFVISLMLGINYTLSSDKHKVKQYKVEETGQLGGRSKQAFSLVNSKGLDKKIIFKRGTRIHTSNFIKLDISEGFFGFDVIKKRSIVK